MKFDIIIVGGGMVGAAMASALHGRGFHTALIDATPLTPSEDHRLIALNYGSICLFKNLNIWPALQPHAAAIEEVHVSHRGHFGTTRITASEFKLPALGYVVPAKYINAALYENLENETTLIRPAFVKNILQDNETATVTAETPEGIKEFTAKIIIGADGTHSTVRKLLNIATEETPYQQSALVTVTELHRSHRNIAYERFQSSGAIAMLPLTGERAATIWTDSNESITQLMQLSDVEFLEKLQENFGYRLGKFKKCAQRYRYPLHGIQAAQKVKEHVILIGNAAHTLHPIAAQGLNLALYEIAELADYFAAKNNLQLSLYDFATQQQKSSIQVSHHLSWLFSNDFFVMNLARQMGMVGLDLFHSLKKRFTTRMIGQSGKVPLLLKEREQHETLNS